MKIFEKKSLFIIIMIISVGLLFILMIWLWYGRQLDGLDKRAEDSKAWKST